MKLYCQKDDRWADDRLGASSVTVGRMGCVASCVAMLSSAWNADNGVTPGEVASHDDWFTGDSHPMGGGLIIWGRISLHGLRFDKRVRNWDGLPVAYASMVNKDTAALIEVEIVGAERHWVIAVKWDPIAGWRVADPLTGKYRWIPAHWKPVGYALFSNA